VTEAAVPPQGAGSSGAAGTSLEGAPRAFLAFVLLLVPLLPLPSYALHLVREALQPAGEPERAPSVVPPIDLDLPKWALGGALLALLGAFLLGRAALRRHVPPFRLPLAGAWLLLLVVWQALSSLWAMNGDLAWQAAHRTFTLFLVYAYVVNLCARDGADLRPMAAALCAAAGIVSAYGLLQSAGLDFPGVAGGERRVAVSTLGNTNFASEWIVATLPFSVGLAISDSRRLARAGFAGVALLSAIHLVLTETRAGWLSLAAAAVLGGAWALSRVERRALALFLLAAGAAAAGIFLFSQADTPSAVVRREIDRGTVAMALDHPALGVGAGNFPIAFPAYRSAKEVRLSGLASEVPDAHNEYLQAAAELGVPGLVVLLLFAATAVRDARRAFVRSASASERCLAAAAGVSILGALVNAALRSPLHNPAAALAFAFAAGAAGRLGSRRTLVASKPTRFTILGPIVVVLASLPFAIRPLVWDRWCRAALAAERQAEAASAKADRFRDAGLADLERESRDEAREDLERAARLLSNAADAARERWDYRFRLAKHLVLLSRTEEAQVRLREAIAIHPNFVEARNDLGALLARAGKLAEAERELLEASRIGPPRPDVLGNLGLVYEMMGRGDRARDYFERALSIDPGSVAAREGLERLRGR
jgi:O-antigen ligase